MVRALGVFSAFLLVILTACGGGSNNQSGGGNGGGSGSGSGSNGGGGNSIAHVVVVVFENQDYDTVIGNSAMPYFNSLANSAALATQFYANVHPSIGNYFLMTAGVNPTVGASDPDQWSGTISGANVASLLSASGKTWKVYAQSLPSTGYLGGDSYPYVKHHNPFAYFDTVQKSQSLAASIVDLSQLSSDVSSGTLPTYSFVVPDDQHNGHDCPNGGNGCPLSDRLAAIDNFLQTNFDPLLKNTGLIAHTILIVTFDESESDNTNGGGRIPVIIAGGPVKASYQSSTMYQFPSLLRFSLQSLGQATYPGAASSAVPMTEFLKQTP
jgi:acid phosphatase